MERPELTRQERKRLRAFVKTAAALYAPPPQSERKGGPESSSSAVADRIHFRRLLRFRGDCHRGDRADVESRRNPGAGEAREARDRLPHRLRPVAEHGLRTRASRESLKISDEEVFKLLPLVYDFIYGVATAARVKIDGITYLYMGIRADASVIAGMNPGMLSLPAGLVNSPDETIIEAAAREFRGEGGLNLNIVLRPGVAFGPHNAAPSITFVALGDVWEHGDIKPSLEWKGRKMLPVPEELVRMVLDDPDRDGELRTHLSTQGVNVSKVQIAPDIIGPLKTMLKVYPD